MIDIESKLFDTIANVLTEYDPSIACGSEIDEVRESFPFVAISEDENATDEGTITNTASETHSSITFSINIYTIGDLRKSKAKTIRNLIDGTMRGMGFLRVSSMPMVNVNPEVYRIFMRYRGLVATGKEVDGNTVYYVYEK